MVEASCHCGNVRLVIAATPVQVTACNCSICRRLAILCAYVAPHDVTITMTVPTVTYLWGDKCMAYHHCPICFCTTHWQGIGPDYMDRMAVNARLLPLDVQSRLRIRRFDGADTWTYLDDQPSATVT